MDRKNGAHPHAELLPRRGVDRGDDVAHRTPRAVMMLRRISTRWQSIHPDHFRIARTALWVLLFSVVAKLASATKEIAIAWRYGRGPEVDAYNLALTLSTWLPTTLFSVMTVVLVPTLVRLHTEDRHQRRRFLSELNSLALAAGLILMAVVWVAAPWLVQWFAAGLPVSTRELAREMLLGFVPVTLLTLLAAMYAIRLQASHNHRYVLAEGLQPLAVVLLVLAWQTAETAPLIAGTLVGAGIQTLWLARLVHSEEGAAVGITRQVRSEQWSALWRSALVIGAGSFAMSFTHLIDQYFAANLGPGTIATLGYANRIIGIGMVLGATVISRATLPIFSEGIAQGEHVRIHAQASRWAGLTLILGLKAAFILWLLAPWLVALLFERGAFTAQDTELVAEALRWGVWQVPFYLGGLVLVQFLAGKGLYRVIAASAFIGISVKIVMNFLLSERLGLVGIMLATVTMYALTAIYLLYLKHDFVSGKKR